MPVLMAIPGRRLELCGHSLKLRRQATAAAAAAVVYAFVTRQSLTQLTSLLLLLELVMVAVPVNAHLQFSSSS